MNGKNGMSFQELIGRLKRFLLSWWGWDVDTSLSDTSVMEFDAQLVTWVRELAQEKQRPEGELVEELITAGLNQALIEQAVVQDIQKRWETLSSREQQVTMLICQGYTNRQIAVCLEISQETVKVYVRGVLGKMGMHSRYELRDRLSGWDFGAWNAWLDSVIKN
jgi:DNA-binding NarL/FixJ family response regulator